MVEWFLDEKYIEVQIFLGLSLGFYKNSKTKIKLEILLLFI
jgi:hypothetical protein